MLVNTENFLRWDDGIAPSSVESDIATGYHRDPNRCDYRPLLAAAEAMRFYINVPAGIAFIDDPNTHLLALVNELGTVVNADIATLQVHTFATLAGTAKTYYAEVIIDGTVPAGNYYYQIRTAAAVVKLTSNQFTVVPAGNDHRVYSTLAKFRHDRYFYGINYQDLALFYQQFRLHLNQVERQFEGEKEIYKEVTTGKERTYNNFMSRIKTVESYFFDKLAHDAAAVLFDHDEIYLNLKRYRAKGTYKIDTDDLSKISKGTVELYDEEFASANRCS
jgi:hypothetical protein